MFFVLEHSITLSLHPSYFTPSLSQYLQKILYETVEGSCSGALGYIVAVLDIKDPGRGRIRSGGEGGGAEFVVRYEAIVFRPFRGEVVDGLVSGVNKMGIFVDVGPLACFISTHLIPADFQFDPTANPPSFASNEDPVKIEKGTKIRLKIVGTRVDANEIFAIGTIKEDYLGVI